MLLSASSADMDLDRLTRLLQVTLRSTYFIIIINHEIESNITIPIVIQIQFG